LNNSKGLADDRQAHFLSPLGGDLHLACTGDVYILTWVMNRLVLFEDAAFANLLPLTYWRTVFDLRCGRSSLAERIAKKLQCDPVGLWTRVWIADVAAERWNLPINQSLAAGDVLVNGRWLVETGCDLHAPPYVATCDDGIAYVACDAQLAQRLGPEDFLDRSRWPELVSGAPSGPTSGSLVEYPWDLVAATNRLLATDWSDSDAANDGEVHASSVLLRQERIRIETGATILPCAVIDASDGPVVIEEAVTVHPHACIRGPAHVGHHTVIHAHAHIHGGTSIGPVSKVGGEVDACVFQGYSNKAHAGFLGHAFVGSWVNLGAGCTNSDLKNTYGTIRALVNGQEVDTGLMFFGCAIGDFVKTGIQQAISTGSVIGFGANVATSGILPRFVGSFTWLTDSGFDEGDAVRLADTAGIAMKRRDCCLSDAERALFKKLPEIVAFFEPSFEAQKSAFDAARGRSQPEVAGLIPKPAPLA